MAEEKRITGFHNNRGRGFSIDLPNGVTISTQFAGGNYCNNRDRFGLAFHPVNEFLSCENAEIAAWIRGIEVESKFGIKSNPWITKELRKVVEEKDEIDDYEDDVEGYVTVGQWIKYFKAALDFDVKNYVLKITPPLRKVRVKKGDTAQ